VFHSTLLRGVSQTGKCHKKDLFQAGDVSLGCSHAQLMLLVLHGSATRYLCSQFVSLMYRLIKCLHLQPQTTCCYPPSDYLLKAIDRFHLLVPSFGTVCRWTLSQSLAAFCNVQKLVYFNCLILTHYCNFQFYGLVFFCRRL
jgi:hypothetical protein